MCVTSRYSKRTAVPKRIKPRATHTARELQDIRETFGTGSDVALRSIQKDTGFKVTVIKRH